MLPVTIQHWFLCRPSPCDCVGAYWYAPCQRAHACVSPSQTFFRCFLHCLFPIIFKVILSVYEDVVVVLQFWSALYAPFRYTKTDLWTLLCNSYQILFHIQKLASQYIRMCMWFLIFDPPIFWHIQTFIRASLSRKSRPMLFKVCRLCCHFRKDVHVVSLIRLFLESNTPFWHIEKLVFVQLFWNLLFTPA